jgi:hypothetical protein
MQYNCPACGRYELSYEVYEDKLRAKPEVKQRVSHWIRLKQLNGEEPPQIKTDDELGAVLQSLPSYDPSEKPDLCLVSLGKLVPTPGALYKLDAPNDYTIACASGPGEFDYYVASLAQMGYLGKEEGSNNFQISVAGWQRIAELRTRPITSRTAFVAMRFLPEMMDLYATAFAPAIRDAGFRPEISGDPQHNDRIDARIMVQIKSARFVVADVTHENPGVYFEAGYAIGLGLPVIWTCAEASKEKMHFDTRQYSHILYKSSDDLKNKLRDRTKATI